jgi:hypothetical protein
LSTEQKHRILRAVSQEAKSIYDRNFGLSVHQVRVYVDQMESAGLVVHRDDDMLEITQAGRAELSRPTSIATAPMRITFDPLEPKRWLCPRSGGDDHKRFKSLT